MRETFYRRVGRRYRPVSEYDSELMDALPEGHHLISVQVGLTSRRFDVDPSLAPMIAAGLYAEDAISRAIYNAMELKPHKVTMTVRQLALMEELTASMNQQDAQWIRPCARDAAEAGVRALQAEAQRRMNHPAVRQAYEHFLTVARLCDQSND